MFERRAVRLQLALAGQAYRPGKLPRSYYHLFGTHWHSLHRQTSPRTRTLLTRNNLKNLL